MILIFFVQNLLELDCASQYAPWLNLWLTSVRRRGNLGGVDGRLVPEGVSATRGIGTEAYVILLI